MNSTILCETHPKHSITHICSCQFKMCNECLHSHYHEGMIFYTVQEYYHNFFFHLNQIEDLVSIHDREIYDNKFHYIQHTKMNIDTIEKMKVWLKKFNEKRSLFTIEQIDSFSKKCLSEKMTEMIATSLNETIDYNDRCIDQKIEQFQKELGKEGTISLKTGNDGVMKEKMNAVTPTGAGNMINVNAYKGNNGNDQVEISCAKCGKMFMILKDQLAWKRKCNECSPVSFAMMLNQNNSNEVIKS